MTGLGEDTDVGIDPVIEKVGENCPLILKDKPIDVFVSELGDSSVNFAVRPWCKSEYYWDVYFYMHENIKIEFLY